MSNDPFHLTPEEIAELEKMLEITDTAYGSDFNYDDFGYWDGTDSSSAKVDKCFHEWNKDSFFSKNVYYTCKHCGKKKEEL